MLFPDPGIRPGAKGLRAFDPVLISQKFRLICQTAKAMTVKDARVWPIQPLLVSPFNVTAF